VCAFVEEFLLEDVKNYRYLTHGNVTVAGQDDAELYRQLVEAMDIMGFTKEEQDGMLFQLTTPGIDWRSIAMSVSVCLFAYLCACLFVCMSVCPLAYLKNARPNFTKFSVRLSCGRVSVLL